MEGLSRGQRFQVSAFLLDAPNAIDGGMHPFVDDDRQDTHDPGSVRRHRAANRQFRLERRGRNHGRLRATNPARSSSVLPIAATMYCLPSNMYVIGAPVTPEGSSVSQRMRPVALSNARN